VDSVKSSEVEVVIDLVAGQPEAEELFPGHVAVLLGGQLGDSLGDFPYWVRVSSHTLKRPRPRKVTPP
jgi:hypothetical protein